MGKKKKGAVSPPTVALFFTSILLYRCVIILLPWLGQLGHLQSLVLPSGITWIEIDHHCEASCIYDHTLQSLHVCREEAAGIIAGQHRGKESGALAAYEEQLNDVRLFMRYQEWYFKLS